ncbi:MAG: ABC transporter permease [Saprospiraceae bacterium]
MNTLENIKLALIAVRSNFLRSLITLFIIVTGMTALIGILTAIDVILFSLSDSFSDIGANSFSIERSGESVRGNRGGKGKKRGEVISFDQALEFKEKYDYPATVSISIQCTSLATIKYKNEKTNPNVSVKGGDLAYIDTQGFEVEYGRSFSETEIENGVNRAIIGQDIVNTLFNKKAENALGKTISNGNVKYKVIGVLKSKGASFSSNEDRMILIPITNAVRYYDTPSRNYALSVGVNDATQMDDAESQAIGTFRNVRRLKAGQENDFKIFKSDGVMDILKDNTVTIRLATIVIGLVTLFGAAIGLMNIMLVSVTERTREIGICKAIGASRSNILIQFLTEAVVISVLGGIIGIFMGILMGNALALFFGGSFVIPWMWIGLGFLICFLVGVVSGFYPAIKASALDPIESLRYE